MSPEVKPEGFISSVKPVDRTPIVEEITDHSDPKCDVRDEYRLSVSFGAVYFVDNAPTSVPVKILCDTGATQTFKSKHTLHFDTSFATGESVTVHIIGPAEGGYISVPLHLVILVSDIVSGSDVVGVMYTRPMEGVSMLSENDLAGGKVIAKPEVVKEPVTSAKTDTIEEEVSSVIPSCVMTKAQARKMAEDTRASIIMDDKQDESRDPSIKIDQDQDDLIKIDDLSVIGQDPSISIDRNRDKDQDGGPNKGKCRLRLNEDFHDRKTTKTERWRRSESDSQDRHRDEDIWRRGTPDDEPRDDVGRRQNDACDDRGPRKDLSDDDRGSRRDSDDHHVPLRRSDERNRILGRELENEKHRKKEEIGGLTGERATREHDGECPGPETSDWCWESTQAMDVDYHKAFDTTFHYTRRPLAIPISVLWNWQRWLSSSVVHRYAHLY